MAISDERLSQQLRFDIPIYWDPVPDWILKHLDKSILIDLVSISLERAKNINEINNKAIDQTLAAISRRK